jgi:hypothetical protein
MRFFHICLITGALGLLLPRESVGQELPRFRIGGGGAADLLVGNASDFLDGGLGGFLGVEYRLDAGDHLRLYVDGGWSALKDDRDPILATTAENAVFTILGGPRLVGHFGPLRPFVAPSLGILGVRWRFEPGRIGGDDAGTETGLAWGAHAGLAVSIGSDYPLELGLEGRLLQAGEYGFARAPAPSGGDSAGFVRTDFGVISVRLSAMIAM